MTRPNFQICLNNIVVINTEQFHCIFKLKYNTLFSMYTVQVYSQFILRVVPGYLSSSYSEANQILGVDKMLLFLVWWITRQKWLKHLDNTRPVNQ